MTIIVSSDNFVKAGSLPVLPISISAGRAYEAFVTSESSALVVQDNGLPLYYITAHFLKAAIDITADESGLKSATIRSIAFYLDQFLDESRRSFRENISERVHGMTTVMEHLREITVEPIAPRPLRFDEEEPESEPEFKVHVVHNSTGQPRGYYFTARAFMEMTRTPPAFYECSINALHNSGPDSGTNCTVCGGPLLTGPRRK